MKDYSVCSLSMLAEQYGYQKVSFEVEVGLKEVRDICLMALG